MKANSRGYVRIAFRDIARFKGPKYISIHRAVWESFNGPVPEGMHINHKNGVKHDNRLENLEVCTPSENTLHGFKTLGRIAVKNPRPGESNGRAKITEHDVREIRRLYAGGGISQQKLADRFGIDQTGVSSIILRKSWAFLT